MNRGFIAYFGEAIRASAKTIFKNKGFFAVWLYTLMALLGRCTLIFWPMFDLANIRQAKILHAKNEAPVSECFRNALKPSALFSLLGAYCLEALIFIAGILLIAIAAGFFALIGLIISYAVPSFPQLYMILIFCAPCALLLIPYCIVMPIMFAPTPYIVETNPTIGAAAAVSASIQTMRRKGKWTCFLNFFIPCLIIGTMLSAGVGLCMLILLFLGPRPEAMIAICGVAFIFAAAFLVVFPIFHTTYKVAQKSLFEDISLDPVGASKHTAGVNIKKCQGVLFEPETIEENLSVLFDETEDDSVPLPASGARRAHDKSARAGAQKADLSSEEEEEIFNRQDKV